MCRHFISYENEINLTSKYETIYKYYNHSQYVKFTRIKLYVPSLRIV